MFIRLITKFIPPQFYVLALLGYGLVSAFAGGYAVRTWYKASHESALKQLVEKRDNDHAKQNEVRVVVSRLPDGNSARRLFRDWSRKAD